MRLLARRRSRTRAEEVRLQLPRLRRKSDVSSVTLTHDSSQRSPSESSPSHSTSTSNGRPRRPSCLRTALMPRTAHRPLSFSHYRDTRAIQSECRSLSESLSVRVQSCERCCASTTLPACRLTPPSRPSWAHSGTLGAHSMPNAKLNASERPFAKTSRMPGSPLPWR